MLFFDQRYHWLYVVKSSGSLQDDAVSSRREHGDEQCVLTILQKLRVVYAVDWRAIILLDATDSTIANKESIFVDDVDMQLVVAISHMEVECYRVAQDVIH